MRQTFLVNTSDDDWLELWILLCQSNELVKEFAFICLFAQCIVKANFKKAGEICLLDPIDCTDGVAFSIFEKVSFSDKVLNIFRSHQRRYIFSTGKNNQASLFLAMSLKICLLRKTEFQTGGGYEGDVAYPGLSLYHEGMDIVALVSTGEDVWRLQVRGPTDNETWVNYGIKLNI